MKNEARRFLTAAQIRELTRKSDLAGGLAVLRTWLAIVAALGLYTLAPHPLTALVAVLVLGTRQLALAVIAHEAAHGTLMRTRALNEFCGQWLAAGPALQNMLMYRQHHMRHHRATGTDEDPDLGLAEGFPVSRRSLMRKLLRDLCGLTGVKVLLGSLLMLSGRYRYDVSGNTGPVDLGGVSGREQLLRAWRGLAPALVSHALMLGLCLALAQPALYGLWWLAWLTVYQLVLRIRAIAEHAMTTDPEDALNNSRTTLARWWERLLFVPLNVNYHLEHHMLAAVPFFRLPHMHTLLREAGAFDDDAATVATSYRAVLTEASGAPS